MMTPKRNTLLSLALGLPFFLFMACSSGGPGAGGSASLESNIDSVSYGFGYNVGQQMSSSGMSDIEDQPFMAGFNDAMGEGENRLSNAQMQQLLTQYQMQAQQRAQQEQQEQGQQNMEEGQTYRDENAQNEGVTVTDSGLQYEVLEEGSGTSPSVGDSVVVHYEGTTIDGTVFDSSHERGQPQGFLLEGLIQGWQEGIALMQEGAQYRFVIPPELGYGAQGAGQQIGPNETLIFEVELLEVHERDGSGGSGN